MFMVRPINWEASEKCQFFYIWHDPQNFKDQIFFLDCVLVGRLDFGFGDKSGEKVSGRVASVQWSVSLA